MTGIVLLVLLISIPGKNSSVDYVFSYRLQLSRSLCNCKTKYNIRV